MEKKDYKACGWVDIKDQKKWLTIQGDKILVDENGREMRYRVNCAGEIQYYKGEVNGKEQWVTKSTHLKDNYYSMSFSGTQRRVHRLVALAFIDNPENKATVDHINGNKECNCCGNLRWLTQKENNKAHVDRVIHENQNSENHAKTDNENEYVPPSPTCKHWDQCTKKDKNGSIK